MKLNYLELIDITALVLTIILIKIFKKISTFSTTLLPIDLYGLWRVRIAQVSRGD